MVNVGSRTPWGPAQHVSKVATGIWVVSTASHGGVKLASEQNNLVPKGARREDGWYEEDCDMAIPATLFSGIVSDVKTAIASLANWNPDAYKAIFGTDPELKDSLVLRQRKFKEDNKDNFVVFSCRGNNNGTVTGTARKESTGEKKVFIIDSKLYDTRGVNGFVITPECMEVDADFVSVCKESYESVT